jgi:hypothetical protein
MFEAQLSSAMKDAMKSKDTNSLTALRGIKTALINLQVSEDYAGKEVPEDVKLRALQKMVKQRQESFDVFSKNGRNDLAEKESFEISVIEKFLPSKLSDAEVETIVKDTIIEVDAKNQKEMSKVMAALKTKLAGKADNKLVSELVKKNLS